MRQLSVLIVEVVVLETLTTFAPGGNALTPVGGKIFVVLPSLLLV